MRKLLPILILALGAGGFVWLRASRPAAAPVASEEKAWPVRVAPVHPQRMIPQLSLYGRVDSPRHARLSAAVDGDVVEVPVLEGDAVDSGALLVRLDDREARLALAERSADVAELEAELGREVKRHRSDLGSIEHERRLVDLATAEVERARVLAEKSAGSRAGLDAARQALERQTLTLRARELAIAEYPARRAALDARLARARAAHERAAIDVARTRVSAPFAGRVTSVAVAPGDHVRVGAELVGIFDTSAVEIRAQIPLRHLPAVRRGLEEQGSLDARALVDGRVVETRLARLGAEVERGSGGSDGYFRVRGSGSDLDLGRVAELVLDLPPVERAVALPWDALYGGDRIFVRNGDRLHEVGIERVGERRGLDGTAAVLVRSDALQDGTEVVLTQLPNAIEGLRIRVAD